MQQMAALTASLGGLTNLNPLLAQQQQTNAELSSLSAHLGNVTARIDALASGGAPPPGGGSTTTPTGGGSVTVPDGVDYPSKPNPPDHSDLLRYEKHVQDHIQKNRYMEEYDRRRQMEARSLPSSRGRLRSVPNLGLEPFAHSVSYRERWRIVTLASW